MSTSPPVLRIRPTSPEADIAQLDNRVSYGGDPDAVVTTSQGEYVVGADGTYEVVIYREGRLNHVRRVIVEFGFEIVVDAA